MKLKSWKKKNISFEKKCFFFARCELDKRDVACSDRDKRKTFYFIWLADVNVIEEWCYLNRRIMLS
jgi:hypothetical protein